MTLLNPCRLPGVGGNLPGIAGSHHLISVRRFNSSNGALDFSAKHRSCAVKLSLSHSSAEITLQYYYEHLFVVSQMIITLEMFILQLVFRATLLAPCCADRLNSPF